MVRSLLWFAMEVGSSCFRNSSSSASSVLTSSSMYTDTRLAYVYTNHSKIS